MYKSSSEKVLFYMGSPEDDDLPINTSGKGKYSKSEYNILIKNKKITSPEHTIPRYKIINYDKQSINNDKHNTYKNFIKSHSIHSFNITNITKNTKNKKLGYKLIEYENENENTNKNDNKNENENSNDDKNDSNINCIDSCINYIYNLSNYLYFPIKNKKIDD